jgi:hypothetical protein
VEVLLPALVLAALAAAFVLGPLRAGAGAGGEGEGAGGASDRRLDLEAAKEAKYREIRDAQLDHGMGKLSDADFQALDAELRAQAIAILRDLDRLGEG